MLEKFKKNLKKLTTAELIKVLQDMDSLFYLPYIEPTFRECEKNHRVAILDELKERYEKQANLEGD